jgi:uncharacterized protein (DUF433 family)
LAHARVEIDPEIMGGKPVIRGTRIPVELILRKLGAGMSAEAVVTLDDNRAAQAVAVEYRSE